MTITPQTIQSAPGSRHDYKRLGRGNASGKGTMSGRGGKGQTARSGGGSGSARRAFKMMLLKVPKHGGFQSIHPRKETVTLATIERVATVGDVITPAYLKKRGVIDQPGHGVKIVGGGAFTKKLKIQGCFASKTAIVAIEKAGGTITF